MKGESKNPTLWRVIGVSCFISVPAIIISGYGVYMLREWLSSAHGLELPEIVYLLYILVCMWASMWLTAGHLIRDIMKASDHRKR